VGCYRNGISPKRREEKRREENSSQLFSWGLHRGFNFIFGAVAATQMNGLWVRSANERNTKEHSNETQGKGKKNIEKGKIIVRVVGG